MNSPALKKTWEGQVVGEFPLRQWIGGSDHSAVFLTEFSGHKAAVKLIPANTTNVDQLARWRPAMKLSHPHLLRLFDMGRCELDGAQYYYLVMEWAEEDLSQILPQRALSADETAEFLPPLLDTLSYLHGRGFVHGGLQPSNIMATDNQLKLSADRLQPLGQAGARGRAFSIFDAPELAAGSAAPGADIWSLGVTLVEALTQHPPAVVAGQDPLVADAIPEPYRGISRASLRRDPQQRASIARIQSWLRPGSAPAIETPRPRAQSKTPNWRLIAAIAAAVIFVALLFALVTRVMRSGSSSPTAAISSQPPAKISAPSPYVPKPSADPRRPSTPSSQAASPGAVVQQVLPDIPRSARNTIQGKIKITVTVNADATGKVSSASLTSPGPSAYFANLTLQASRRWQFTPPQVGGQPASSTWLLHYRLGRSATEVTPEAVSKR